MTDDFKPSIQSRSTADLLKIVGSPHKWNPRAFKLAQAELYNRKIDASEIEKAKNNAKAAEQFEIEKKANMPFQFFNLNPFDLFINWNDVLLFLFSWEYKKDGYLHKAEVQRKFRFLVLLFLLILIVCSNL